MITLVLSSAYVGQELAAEFGLLPPAFLPVGATRLYELQIAQLAPSHPVYLTLPESYVAPEPDRRRLAELNVIVLPVPDGLQLGEAVTYALNYVGAPEQPVRILHGDTLVEGVGQDEPDLVATGLDADGYSWAEIDLGPDGRIIRFVTIRAGGENEPKRPVACGYFTFRSTTALVRAMTRARGDFIEGLNVYTAERPMAARAAGAWYDFGHVLTYFRSRRAVTTARSFNTLQIDGKTARKSSVDEPAKIEAEAAWFAQVPAPVRIYTARIISVDSEGALPSYETEYEYIPTLAELFVFGTVGPATWRRILGSCQQFLATCAAIEGPGPAVDAMRDLVSDKTFSRLERFAAQSGFDIDAPTRFRDRPMPSLRETAARTIALIDSGFDERETVMHGDFCFSNILYNSRVERIRVIDPRGHLGGRPTIFGDSRYDLAKLAHSIVGRYDFIIAGRYASGPDDGFRFDLTFPETAHQMWLERALPQVAVRGVSAADVQVRAITVSLFLSMLPLHADRPDRQRAFIANALRLFANLEAPAS